MSIIKTLTFKSLGDERGELVSLEEYKNIPFDIKRVYYLVRTKFQVSRGFHAHKNLKQVLVCISGSCKLVLDNGKRREAILLSSYKEGVLVESMIWREMHDFSEDCILLVIASELYDEDDYIRDYSEFLGRIKDATNT